MHPPLTSGDLNSHPELSVWRFTVLVSNAGHRTPPVYQVWSS